MITTTIDLARYDCRMDRITAATIYRVESGEWAIGVIYRNRNINGKIICEAQIGDSGYPNQYETVDEALEVANSIGIRTIAVEPH